MTPPSSPAPAGAAKPASTNVYARAFHSSPAMQTITRLADRRLVEANDAFLTTLGYERDEVVGTVGLEHVIWVSPEKMDVFRAELGAKRFVRHFETDVRTKQGEVRTILLSADLTEIDGEPHVIAAGVDITMRKQVEAKLREGELRVRESEARIRSLYENLSTAVVVQDESGFLQANPAAWKLFGTEQPQDFFGRHPPDFSAPMQADGEDSRTAAQRHIARALAEGSDRFEWIGRKLDGTDLPLDVTLTSVQLEGRTVIQAVITDLTERKRAEAEHEQALQRERELSQLKTDFVALVSHEFRTPLEIIMSSVDNLDRYHERLAPEQRRQLLQTINKSVRRMAGMMEEVLLLGRLDSGGTEFKPAPLEMRVFCQRVCDEMQSATNRRCPITLEIEGDMAAACGDESVLRHILTNLLSNAVKYSPEGAAARLKVARRGGVAVIQVVDRGCGIPAADQKRLFQAFHRGSNVRQVPGTGLGLLIVRRCVELHGGEIDFESREGQGTTFTVRVPLFAEKR